MPIAAGLIVRRIKDKIFAETGHFDVFINEQVIVETEHGQEIGIVIEREKMIEKQKDQAPFAKIVRKITKEDKTRMIENEAKNVQAHKIVLQKTEDHELAMKLTSTQYTFDRSKLFIYYTAENRVDFRELIKDLGHMLKTRIQMVQIGVRDEAKMIGGIGTCGRKLCCKSFLKEFSSVTIDMAKEQDLSLNTSKLSGLCGRLMCCLAYENECYKHSKKKLPKIGSKVHTPAGQGTVIGFNCLKEEITVHISDNNVKTFKLDQLSHTILDKMGL